MGKVDFSKLPGFQAKTGRALNAGLTAAARAASGFIKRGMSRGSRFAGSAPGTPPNVQRAGLRNAVSYTASTRFKSSVGAAATVPYAAIQEFGGTIRPKTARALPVPVNHAAKRHMEKAGTPRGLDLIPIKSRGRLFLVPRPYKNGRQRSGPVFMLTRSVTLRPRPYIRPGVYRNLAAIKAEAVAASARVMRGRA